MSEKISEHPGYYLIRNYMPEMYLAVIGHPCLGKTLSPFGVAVTQLVYLYETLQKTENEYARLFPGKRPPVKADRDFSSAFKILKSCYARLDPAAPKGNAIYVAGLLDSYATRMDFLPESSVSYLKSSLDL